MRLAARPLLAIAFMTSAFAYKSPDLGNLALFPADNYWYWDISGHAVHPNSAALVASVGKTTSVHPDFGTTYAGQPWGIPYAVVGAGQAKVPINYVMWGDESDPGPFPIPMDAPIEGGTDTSGDNHVLVVDKDAKALYELNKARPKGSYWQAYNGARWDLASNALRKESLTSADAAGLPILPGLVRYEEVAKGEINHALRMTVRVSRKSYLWPARHQAGSTASADAPPMGMRFRLKAGYDIGGFPPSAQVVLRALKKYGLIVADNGGDWYISGAPDERFDDEAINTLKKVKGADFEAVLSVDANGEPIRPGATAIPGPKPAARSALGNLGGTYPSFDPLGRSRQNPPWTAGRPGARYRQTSGGFPAN